MPFLKGKCFEQKRDPQIPDSVILAPELETIKKAVSSYYQIDESELLKSRRGRFNEPRSMAIYLTRKLRKDSLSDIGAEFRLSGYSSVGSALETMGKLFQKNQGLQKRYETIKNFVMVGQTET